MSEQSVEIDDTLTDDEWSAVCRAAGPEHTERACDDLKVTVERILSARLNAPPDPSRDPAPKPDCACDDPQLERLRELITGGMGQWEASRVVWPIEEVPKRWRR